MRYRQPRRRAAESRRRLISVLLRSLVGLTDAGSGTAWPFPLWRQRAARVRRPSIIPYHSKQHLLGGVLSVTDLSIDCSSHPAGGMACADGLGHAPTPPLAAQEASSDVAFVEAVTGRVVAFASGSPVRTSVNSAVSVGGEQIAPSLPVRPRSWQGYRPSIYHSALHRLRDRLS